MNKANLFGKYPLLKHGKVRDIYQLDTHILLIVTTDRISAFDYVLPNLIKGKGRILNKISNFWFNKFSDIIPNHLSNKSINDFFNSFEIEQLNEIYQVADIEENAIIVNKLQPLPIEAVVRGYLIGGGWEEYISRGSVSGIKLPSNIKLAEQLEYPLFTPSTKANVGDKDKPISFKEMVKLLKTEHLAEQVKDISLEIYKYASKYFFDKGIIVADTKFEFGLNEKGTLYLIDEVLTPDSSRFWDKESYRIGFNQDSLDKQIIRDYLLKSSWDMVSNPPFLPDNVINKTIAKYQEVANILLN